MVANKRLVVIGNGMVGHRFVERMIDGGHHRDWNISVFCEERRLAYDRVNLTSFFGGKSAADLALARPEHYRAAGIDVVVGDKAVAVDRQNRTVVSAHGRIVSYDKLVLATGSSPFIPPIDGCRAPGCFVYRTLEDLDAIRTHAAAVHIGVIIGGGLLGLEAAHALKQLGLRVHVVELAPRLMSLQIDEAGGTVLRARIEQLGVTVHTGKATAAVLTDDDDLAVGIRFTDGSELPADLVVFSAGIRPRDELARKAKLLIGERGGIVIDERCCTSDPDIHAIGECALHDGRIYGLVGPGYQMAEVAVDVIAGADGKRFESGDMSAKLNLLGVDVASFGDAFALTRGARIISFFDGGAGIYKKLVLSPDGTKLVGGVLVGDASAYDQLHELTVNRLALPPHPEELILPSGASTASFRPTLRSLTTDACLKEVS
jgi:nitrite reductase (NADH) large subunit